MRSLNSSAATVLGLIMLMVCAQACNRDSGTQTTANQNEKPPETFADAQSAATQSLASFRQLVNKDNFKDLGFESPDEIANATLGEPIPVIFVGLNQLREYKQGSDPNALLSSISQTNYPVMARGQVRSSVVVEQVNGKWHTASLGNGALAKAIAAVRKPAAAGAAASGQQALIYVGALGIHFVGERVENKWMLTPLSSSSELDLRAGAAVPAEEVFARLAAVARTLKDDAPA